MSAPVVAILGTRYRDFSVEERVLKDLAVEIVSGPGDTAEAIRAVASEADVVLAGSAPAKFHSHPPEGYRPPMMTTSATVSRKRETPSRSLCSSAGERSRSARLERNPIMTIVVFLLLSAKAEATGSRSERPAVRRARPVPPRARRRSKRALSAAP